MIRSLVMAASLIALACPAAARDEAPAAVAAANRAALREPTPGGYRNAVQVYPYAEGAIYRLYAAPERVTDITLQPGEQIISVAAGDTTRWTVGDTTSGSGTAQRVHVLVKPFAAGLATNLVITTDRRAYHLQMESTDASAMAALSWTYPRDELIALQRQREEAQAARPVASGLDLQGLNFHYEISGDRPAWRPLRAFDDGRQTFIEFPPDLATGEAPPLFVIGEDGEAQLVNYRVAGRFYVVDRLFGAAELRLGGKKQVKVRITSIWPEKREWRGSGS
ncbi:P-type conjugative transfer protein TrbG [Pelagerythrobacter aerophilus]|uniref:P-type conjugative transfer protein TrbG n=1 Tax=Pelagerythrobacter aerophilus TaxID=2306995 RepID=A0A418NLC3_9SPHN|nr:P-type conjugative transfer protein TrbG [Pelagerythrobacter aerophilus]RIV80348.1 P-type conjugative transfer protein TrbG [Pelagerythrobacter aerophilus]